MYGSANKWYYTTFGAERGKVTISNAIEGPTLNGFEIEKENNKPQLKTNQAVLLFVDSYSFLFSRLAAFRLAALSTCLSSLIDSFDSFTTPRKIFRTARLLLGFGTLSLDPSVP